MSKKALFVGINYFGTPAQLAGCINDVLNISQLLIEKCGLKTENCNFLTDDKPNAMPTRANILAGFNWLLQGAKAGDSLFFHFSGHGTQVMDRNRDELDGRDECLVPCDYIKAGFILDDDIYSLLCARVPRGVNLFCILDCCHSGTGMDLIYNYISLGTRDSLQIGSRRSVLPGNIIMLSGCRDDQYSMDAVELNYKTGSWQQQGALSYAFLEIVKQNQTLPLFQFIRNIRSLLASKRYSQIPQLSFSIFPNLRTPLKLL
jgi:hypothetical protein